MALKDNEKFKLISEDIQKQYKNLINQDKLSDEEKRDEILKLFETENTIEYMIFEYLKIEEKIIFKKTNVEEENKILEFKNLLNIYECCIEKNKFNNSFGKWLMKYSAKEKIFNLLSLIKEYYKKSDVQKLNIMNEILSKKVKEYHCSIPINYNVNLELFLNSLYYNFYKKINESYDNNIPSNEKKESKEIDEYFNIEETKLDFLGKDKESLKKQKDLIPYLFGSFNYFLVSLSFFVDNVFTKFSKRFLTCDFKSEEDLLLLEDFLFFLSHFSFSIFGQQYSNIWNDTFEDIRLEEKVKIAQKKSDTQTKFELKNNVLYVMKKHIFINTNYEIKNINDYSFEQVINYLLSWERPFNPNEFHLNKFLKIDKYSTRLYIKTIWNIWNEFLVKILSSKVIKSLFKSIVYDENTNSYLNQYDFLKKDEINLILNNERYFIFKTDFHGMTEGRILSLYFYGDPYKEENTEQYNKLYYLSNNVKWNIHEIIGHLNLRFQYYVFKDKNYKSPRPKHQTEYSNKRNGKESGDFIEELIFEIANDEMTVPQMLYVLDYKNYEKEINDFFKGYKNSFLAGHYNITPEFNNFLLSLGIDKKCIYGSSSCSINRNKNINNSHGQHPLNCTDYDEIY